MELKIGIIADTHGLLRTEALEFLKTCEAIVHAGDIGKEDILKTLKTIAPVYAIRGNIDKWAMTRKMPDRDVVEIGGRFLYLIHRIDDLDLDPAAAGFHAVIFGHSHRPESYEKDRVLYFNPGSAGPRRFRLPVSMGCIRIFHDRLDCEVIRL